MTVRAKLIYGVGVMVVLAGIILVLIPRWIRNNNIRKQEKLCYQFLLTKMTTPTGAIKRRLSTDDVRMDKEENSILSESAGLIMLYAVAIDDTNEFEKQYKVVKDIFLGPYGLMCWKIHIPSGKEEKCNASLDDLRVAQALILAYEKWGIEKYHDLAEGIADRIRLENVVEDFLTEGCCWDRELESLRTVDLSYLDIEAIDKVSQYQAGWSDIGEQARRLLSKGVMPSGFFYDKYDIRHKEYYNYEQNLINNILCAIQAVDVGDNVRNGVYQLLKDEWGKNKKIMGGYDLATGLPSVDYESIAVYALAMRLALEERDVSFARGLYNKILSWQVMAENSYFYGAFADNEAHSFDNLQVLLAFAEWRKR